MKSWLTLLLAAFLFTGCGGGGRAPSGGFGGDPDLVIGKVAGYHHAMKSVRVEIKNIGEATAAASHLRLFVPGFSVEPAIAAETPVKTIEAKHTAWVKIGADTPLVIIDEQNHLHAARPFQLGIDSKFEVSEFDEENNVVFFAPTAKSGGTIKIPKKK